jgi:5-methylcytosine-specific restriction endonuclease McrA
MPKRLQSISNRKRRIVDYRPSPSARGYGHNWRKVRVAMLSQKPLCEDCLLEGMSVSATEVDHIDGDVRNLLADNLRCLCKSHHSRKTVACNGGLGHKRN